MKKLNIALAALILLSMFTHAFADMAPTSRRPNIVFILLDDLDTVVTKRFYDRVLPESMKLKREGVTFDNTFVTTPLCCPSRAAILSGRYAHNTNVYNNGAEHGGRWQFKDDEPRALPAHLFRAGYRTAMIGKYLNGFGASPSEIEKLQDENDDSEMPPLPWGWTDGNVFISKNLKKYKGYNYHSYNWKNGTPTSEDSWASNNKDVSWHGETEEDYSTDFVKRKTIEFMQKAKRENDNQPFFAYVNPTCPHFPLPPAKRHLEQAQRLWGASSFPSNRPNFHNGHGALEISHNNIPEDVPSWLSSTWNKRMRLKNGRGDWYVRLGGERPRDIGSNSWHEVDWFNRMGSLYACDELVGDVVKWLKDNNEWDNTILVFTSDNGYNLGAHGLAQKLAPYEESLRVPLIIAGGRDLNLRRNVREPNWALNIDFTPTLLQMAGVNIPDYIDGQSLCPMLQQGAQRPQDWRTQFNIEYIGPGMANGYLPHFATYHYRWAPAFFLDVPSFNAIRGKRTVMENGRRVEKEFLLVEWERWKKKRLLRRRLNSGRQRQLRRMEDGRHERRAQMAEEMEYELYNITDDPYQLDNLLFYRPVESVLVRDSLITEMRRMETCRGPEECK